MKCSFCTKNAILVAGKEYCDSHIGTFESGYFLDAVKLLFKRECDVDEFFVWAFGSKYPKCSDLQKWHSRIPREENVGDKWRLCGIYKESQDDYIQRIAQKYLSRNDHAEVQI